MVTEPLNEIEESRHVVKNYVCAIGASLVVTMFDGMRNGHGSAIKKASLWFSDTFGSGSPGMTWSIAALIFFGVASALMVLAYKPKSSKESFLLGIGVLGILYASITPPQPQKIGAIQPKELYGFSILSTAHAQPTRLPDFPQTDVWFIVEGAYRSLTPFITLSIYPADGSRSVYRNTIFGVDMVRLPQGRYHFELSLADYRSIVFTADIKGEAVGFSQISMSSVPFEYFLNALGPIRVKPWKDESMGIALSRAQALCLVGDQKAAQEALSKVRSLERSTLNVMYGTKDRFCLNN